MIPKNIPLPASLPIGNFIIAPLDDELVRTDAHFYGYEGPDADYPMILTTGRQLEHWHTGSMTRRATVLDAVEPEANCSLHPSTLRKLGLEAGGKVRLTTKRGSIEVMARSDRAVAPDMVFLPFAYVEAAANVLTNPQLDPFGKIPEFKFSACRVEKAERDEMVAAE